MSSHYKLYEISFLIFYLIKDEHLRIEKNKETHVRLKSLKLHQALL